MKIRNATINDVPAILGLERSSPPAAHWEERRYWDLFHSSISAERLVIVAEQSSSPESGQEGDAKSMLQIVGFLIARHVASEWELENIAVHPAFQRQGVAKQLLDAFFSNARQANSESAYLEVRESNAAARNLYEKAGFAPTGRRKSYYSNPQEDAILYHRLLI